ncbi:hypothetical protein BN9982_2280002 [Mycobacterium tuberculosis]|nr:hypothetical protein BN9982_2280002 [Mycobacterium tuberculosis]
MFAYGCLWIGVTLTGQASTVATERHGTPDVYGFLTFTSASLTRSWRLTWRCDLVPGLAHFGTQMRRAARGF